MTAALHELAEHVDCPKKPRGCSAPAGERCVNWSAHRAEGEHPPAMRAPHAARLKAAQAAIPQQRQIEAAPDNGEPLPPEPEFDEDHDDPWA